MITVTFENETGSGLRAEMRDFLGLDVETSPAPAKTTTTRSTKKADKEPDAGNAAAPGAGATSDQGSQSGASSAQTSPSETPSREDIAKKAVLYGQPGKGGPVALKELLGKHGAPNQKWSEVPEDNLPALNVELDELLA